MGAELSSSFRIVRHLGAGSMGRIDLVINKKGQQYALKTLSKKTKRFRSVCVQREIKAGQKLNHEGVVASLGSWEDEDNTYILMNYVEGEDLITYMVDRNGEPIEEAMGRRIFLQILKAVMYIHSKGIAHRDLKLDNIMIDRMGRTKIVDFGLCKTKKTEHCTDRVGSGAYCAPEIVHYSKPYDGKVADVYSLGVILFSLLFGFYPFTEEDRQRMQHGQVQMRFPASRVSNSARDLISSMLQVDPSKRIACRDIIKHEWFTLL
eukprot:TRINITY_DN22295_c0_g1_i1.p1 TRINITY_DN22295_c0_g1~~TRINITY_DN22295_c0_g1_i1.p1  ORF type:complete len:263 (-),score=74.56 TRINITY_DN22295_c0_g1_i1:8-796(-)